MYNTISASHHHQHGVEYRLEYRRLFSKFFLRLPEELHSRVPFLGDVICINCRLVTLLLNRTGSFVYSPKAGANHNKMIGGSPEGAHGVTLEN